MKLRFLIFIVSIWTFTSAASPTSNEFMTCDKMAVATLKSCLENKGSQCWVESQTNYDSCRKEIALKHQPNKQRIQAEAKFKNSLQSTTQ
ncbi:hypothetical protein EK599_09875 [Vibrio sp. T187]|uniref:hypothetical protein n=1 Tax=Vibrio TaxID=662 RepID=UPI0010C99A25|nr:MULTISPECIES: hypothetical protein [Vibrio]MBW3696005.1 hypothetical protein [Vibrio sp. T187]